MATFSCKTKSNRWTIAPFAYILNICRVNAATVLAMNRGSDTHKVNSYNFGMDLALRLIRHMSNNFPSLGFKPRYIIKLICFYVNYGVFNSRQQDASSLNNTQYPQKCKNRKRCRACVLEISGPGQKKRKNNMTKTKNQCQICGKPACCRHSIQLAQMVGAFT